jgi:hypothetical protein
MAFLLMALKWFRISLLANKGEAAETSAARPSSQALVF